jgi:hypothetical protein
MKRKHKRTASFPARWIGALTLMAGVFCGNSPPNLAGGGSDTEVSGRIVAIDGTARAGITVSLIAAGYDPAFDGGLPLKMITATDITGNYHFGDLTKGSFNLQADRPEDGTKILVNSIMVDSGQARTVPDATLKKTATVMVAVPDSLKNASGFIIAPGTLLKKFFSGEKGLCPLDSVPQGTLASIQFKKSEIDSTVLFRNVVVASADTIILSPWLAWAKSAKIALNTTSSGASIEEAVLNFPVLVRLTKADFNFSLAKPNGEDIRFVKQDYSALSFEIEDWDSAAATASIWVKADTIYGSNADQYFLMLWANPDAKDASNAAAVFDTANGFQGVWHLGQSGGTTQKDATANHFNGTPVQAMNGSSDVSGIIGRAQNFDGTTQWIEVLNARNSRLDVQNDSFYTVSLWANAHTLDNTLHVLFSKGSAHYGLMINERNQWEFYGGLAGYGVDTTTTAAATADVWTLLTGVRKGKKQYLFMNGVAVDSALEAAGGSPALSGNVYDLIIGRQSDNQAQEYDGLIDEPIVSDKARTASWIRMCYQNQKSDQALARVIAIQ